MLSQQKPLWFTTSVKTHKSIYLRETVQTNQLLSSVQWPEAAVHTTSTSSVVTNICWFSIVFLSLNIEDSGGQTTGLDKGLSCWFKGNYIDFCQLSRHTQRVHIGTKKTHIEKERRNRASEWRSRNSSLWILYMSLLKTQTQTNEILNAKQMQPMSLCCSDNVTIVTAVEINVLIGSL